MSPMEKLQLCSYPTRLFFNDIAPMMRKADLYGWLEESVDTLSAKLVVSPAWLYQSLNELQKKGVLKRGKSGLYCPHIVAEIRQSKER